MKTSIIVQNLKCDGCARTITEKLSGLAHISGIEVDTEQAMVSFLHKNPQDSAGVEEVLASLGYPSVDSKNNFALKTRSFFSCAKGRLS